jgi:transcriptional regulator with XRE-family HTH domain
MIHLNILIIALLRIFCPMPRYNRIRIVLAEQDKKSAWLAEQLGYNKSTVSRWCSNTMQPDMESLFKIAAVLDVDVRELLVSTKEE